MKYQIYCDGGARGNPGPAGVGYVVYDGNGKILVKGSKYLGEATNNIAEYSAVIEALKWFTRRIVINKKPKDIQIEFFLDSMLVVNQLNGLYKIKNAHLRNLAIKVRQLENDINGQIIYRFIPREKNTLADSLVNKGINTKK